MSWQKLHSTHRPAAIFDVVFLFKLKLLTRQKLNKGKKENTKSLILFLAFLLFLGLFRFVFGFEKVFYLIQFLFFAVFFFLIFKEISKFIFNWLLCFFSLFLYFLMVLFEKGEKNLKQKLHCKIVLLLNIVFEF